LLTTSSHAPVSERHVPRRFRVSLGFANVRAVLAIAALVATVLLVTDSSQFDRIYRRSRVSRVLPNLPTFWHPASLYADTQFPVRDFYNDFGTGAPRIPYFPSRSFIRTDSSDENYSIEQSTPTYDCSVNLYCRARLVLTKNGTLTTVQVGYYIYSVDGDRSVVDATQQRVSAVTEAEATAWATQLLGKVNETLTEAKCEVSVSMVSDAIMKTKDDASKCPNTGDSLCSTLITVNECEDNPPDEEVVTEEAVPTGDCSGGLFCRA
ncbi:unnamed protein product, partial [Agarophyton chilense]